MIVSLPESLTRGANLLGGEFIYLRVDIMQSVVDVSEPKEAPSGICLSTLMASSIETILPKAEEEVRINTEVRNS